MSDDVDILDSRIRLLGAINSLRYNGTGIPTPRSLLDAGEVEFLDALTAWLGDYQQMLVLISDTTTNMAQELHDLRSQRKAVRDFLGLPATTTGEPQ